MVVKTLPSKKLNTGNPRPSGRATDELRQVTIETDVNAYAEGSCLISFGNTKVLCTASVEEKVPGWLRGQKQGWVTAEYGMLPRSTHSRMDREAARGKQGGRTVEIQRLIGRSLRAALDLKKLGEYTITIDCDVIQADGGTRTASISGGFVALADAVKTLVESKKIKENPIVSQIAAISVGVYQGTPVLDLDYPEDSSAETDMNVIMNDKGGFIEIQGTAEGEAFSDEHMMGMLSVARKGISEIMEMQREALFQEA